MSIFNRRNLIRPWLSLCASLLLLAASAAQSESPRGLLSTHVPSAVAQSRMMGRVPSNQQLTVSLSLPLRNEQELDALIADVSDPASPNYRHFISPQQFAAKFGPTEADYAAVLQFAREHNLAVVHTHSNRLLVTVRGVSADIERAFHVQMAQYQHPSRGAFFAPDREPSIDLEVPVEHISGLNNYSLPRPMSLHTVPLGSVRALSGSGPAGYYIGKDFRAAYAPAVKQTGAGQYVALVEFDGFYASDVAANFSVAGLSPVAVQTVLLDGFNGAPGSNNDEVVLDIMMAAYMAPGLSGIISYEGYTPNDVLNRIATDNKAKQVSSSWGFPIDATTEQIFKQYVAQGQSYLQASGDSGAYTGVVMTPSDEPNATVVGGTNLSTSGAAGPWSGEVAWSGSGGGISTVYPIPSYQQNTSLSAAGGSTKMRNLPDVAANAGSGIYLICNNGQAVGIGGTSAAAPIWAGFVSLANQEAVANGKPPVGFLNPTLYSIGNGNNYITNFHDVNSGSNGSFKAVTGYDLATGWGSPTGQTLVDALAGPSSPAFTLAGPASAVTVAPGGTATAAISVQASGGFNSAVSFAVSGLPTGVTAAFNPASSTTSTTLTFTASSATAPGAYSVTVTGKSGSLTSNATVSLVVSGPSITVSASNTSIKLNQGGSAATSTISLKATGVTGNVALSASGMPSGLTVTFNPTSIATTASSVATFTPSVSVAPGQYNVVVTGTAGSVKGTVTIQVTVSGPSVTLTPASTSVSLSPGSSATDSISVVTTALSSSVTLSASGLPTGLTAAFNPASVSASGGSSTLTLTAASTLAAGTYPITLTAASGTTKTSVTLQVAVAAAPGFTLSLAPTSLTLIPGGASASSTLSATAQNGFSGTISISITGIPAGVSVSTSLNATGTAQVLTFKALTGAVPGTYSVVATGTSGSVKKTATLQVTIPSPNFTLYATPASMSLISGSASSSTIYVSAQNGFSGAVTYSASGLPAGVTSSFSALAGAAGARLTLSASSTAVPGTYPVTVKGISGNTSATTTVLVTIPKPSFTLSQTGSLAVTAGSSKTTTISVVGTNGFASSVSLRASGLPAGVTASFSSAATTSNSQLTLTASKTTAPGNYSIVVNGVSGSLSATITVPFSVTKSNSR